MKLQAHDINWLAEDVTARNLYIKILNWDSTVNDRGCKIWKRSPHANGHGRINVKGKDTYVHRVAYVVFKGPLPPGHVVMHTCDDPMCIEPTHLEAGTVRENSKDLANKGLHPTVLTPERYGKRKRGPKTPKATKDKIVKLYLETGMSQREIAAKVKVSKSMVNKVLMAHQDQA